MTDAAEIPTLPGDELAELYGVKYILAEGVFAVRGDTLAYYCPGEAWHESTAGLAFARQARIAQLEAELADLRATEAAAGLAPAGPKPARRGRPPKADTAPVVAVPPPAPTPEASAPVACPRCERADLKNRKALVMHLWRSHGLTTVQAVAEVNGLAAAPASEPIDVLIKAHPEVLGQLAAEVDLNEADLVADDAALPLALVTGGEPDEPEAPAAPDLLDAALTSLDAPAAEPAPARPARLVISAPMLRCPECDSAQPGQTALDVHRSLVHGIARPADPPPAPLGATSAEPATAASRAAQTEPLPAWRCVTCEATTGRSVADSRRCKACVRAGRLPLADLPATPHLVGPAREKPFQCACKKPYAESMSVPGLCIRCAAEKSAEKAAAAD